MQANHEQKGLFQMSPSGEFKACSCTTIKFRYTVGKKGLAVGGKLKVALPNMGWAEPLTPYPRGCPDIFKGDARQICIFYSYNTTCNIESKQPSEVYLSHRESQNMMGQYHNWSWWITAEVEAGPLVEGDVITITYGDTSLGENGALVQPWVEKSRVFFSAFVDNSGDGLFIEVSGSPVECSVGHGELSKCITTIPSIIRPGQPFRMKMALTDWGCDPVAPPDALGVRLKDSFGRSVTKPNAFGNSFKDKIDNLRSDNDIRFQIEVKSADDRVISGNSNPAVCRSDGLNLYWGDLHCHSFYHMYNPKLGYGHPCTKPDELLKYSKNVSQLDFVALTDGRGALPDNAGWEEGQQAVIDNYIEGEFVTLKGWETQMGADGHRNAIYQRAEIEPHVVDEVFQTASVWGDKAGQGMQGVLDYFQGREDVILIPHHSMVWMNWDNFDPQLDRLVEIYSCWGSSECRNNELWSKTSPFKQSVRYALSKGYRLGFVGGSDSHIGYPGRSISDADRYRFVRYKAGFTGVYAKDLTRESIFEALRNRRCYATTGERIIVEFSVNDKPMGDISDVSAKGKPHFIRFDVTGSEPIRQLEIIRDGESVYTIHPYKQQVEDEWVDNHGGIRQTSYYYLKVIQVDGNTAWASPVWV